MRPGLALQGVMVLFVFPTVRRRIKTYGEDQDAEEAMGILFDTDHLALEAHELKPIHWRIPIT